MCGEHLPSRLLATASADRTIRIWNTRDWTLERTLQGHQRWVWDCAFSADSAYIVSGPLCRPPCPPCQPTGRTDLLAIRLTGTHSIVGPPGAPLGRLAGRCDPRLHRALQADRVHRPQRLWKLARPGAKFHFCTAGGAL